MENDRNDLKKALPFWERLKKQEKELIERSVIPVFVGRGKPVNGSEDECTGILLVKKGSLRVYLLSEDGREITLYRIGAGEVCILSASCVISSITFDIYIDAVTDCEAVKIPSPLISSLMAENIYVESYIYKTATERFSDVMWAMQQILFMSFDKRLAIFLLDEAASLCSCEIRMTHEQIAKLMGSAREVVSRMLKYFKGEGYVSLSRGVVTIKDKKGLKNLLS